jgi:tripartite-type tricarboxylate transporter receptor subunit TctC
VTDVVARIVAQELSTSFGVSVLVDNRPGGNGIIGTQAVARASADGYTLQLVTADTHAIAPSVYRRLPYDVEREFAPIALLVRSSMVLAANSKLVDLNFAEFLADARKHPGKVAAGSYGVGSASHLALASFEKEANVSFLHVPYKGVTPVVHALAAGDISIGFVSPSNIVGLLADGTLKVLGSASANRLSMVRNIPTFGELGFPFTAENWFGLVAPKGVPTDVLKRLESEMARVSTSEAMQAYVKRAGVEMDFRDSVAFAAFLSEQTTKLGEVARSHNITLTNE